MRKTGIYGCALGIAACIVSIWGLQRVGTEKQGTGAVDTILEEESRSSVGRTGTEDSASDPETGQMTDTSPVAEKDWELIYATQSFMKAADDYVVYEYDCDGDQPQREIVSMEDYKDPEAVPQTAVVISEDTIDLMSMTHAVCAIESFCGSTDFLITDTYYAGSGAMVQFAYDNHEYTCMEDGIISQVRICDAVFEMRAADGHIPDEIKIAEPADGAIELREAARAFIQSAGDYVIYEYGEGNKFPQRGIVWLESLDGWNVEYPGRLPGPIVLSKKNNIDYLTLNKTLCAIESFCGGTDFSITDTYYVGSGGSVQFEYGDHEYTCITEAGVTDDMKICDAVFEVHSADGINITVPRVPDEIKVRDGEGVFQTLLTSRGRERVKTGRPDANTVDVVFVEKIHGSAGRTESSGQETGQSMYKSPISEESYVLWEIACSFVKSVEDYVVYEYDYSGEDPQREIVFVEDFEDPGDIPQTAVAIADESISLADMKRALCAIEAFCGSTDYRIADKDYGDTGCRIADTCYVGIGAVVRFGYDNHEYTCIEKGTGGHVVICDAVFEVRSVDGYIPEEIKITEPDNGLTELREAAKTFIQSAGDYVIYEYEYKGEVPERGLLWLEEVSTDKKRCVEDRGDNPDSIAIVLSKKTNIDYGTLNKALCAIEAFCGGTDFCIADTYYAGSGGNVQFEYKNHEYTCIMEAGVTDGIKICDAVFEVHSADGINITVPCMPDEIKVRDEEGVFQTLLTY